MCFSVSGTGLGTGDIAGLPALVELTVWLEEAETNKMITFTGYAVKDRNGNMV